VLYNSRRTSLGLHLLRVIFFDFLSGVVPQGSKMNYRWRKSSCKGKNDPHPHKVTMVIPAISSEVVKLGIAIIRLSGYRNSRAQ
jgi:hypothetical protein